jgi:DNA gyrase subunit B
MALNSVQIRIDDSSTALSEEELKQVADQYLTMNRERARLEKRYNPQILNVIRTLPAISEAEFSNKHIMQSWLATLTDQLTAARADGARYITELYGTGSNEYGVKVTINLHGSESINIFPPEFFRSREYTRFTALESSNKISSRATVQRGEKSVEVTSMKEAFDWLLAEVAQGLHLQRYKGLGEMNPDQLWETTMDSKTRRMSQVRIEDAVAADEIFTTLMGDQVEPRREFIEKNARSVENLDT